MTLRTSILIGILACGIAQGEEGRNAGMIICAPPLVVRDLTFRDATVVDVVSELQKTGRFVRRKDYGLNIVVQPKAGEGRRISGSWDKVELKDLFAEIAKQGDMSVRIDPYAVVLGPRGAALSQTSAAAKRITGELPSAAARFVLPRVYFREATIPEIVEYL